MTHYSKTPIYMSHIREKANMGVFGGYEMPLWYPAGIKMEHMAVLTSAGIFDTSHMSVITVSGNGSESLINNCFCREVTSLKHGRCLYGVFLNDSGGVIDDAIVYKLENNNFMIVVNAGKGSVISEHLNTVSEATGVRINNWSGNVSKIDVQGPESVNILYDVIENPRAVFNGMSCFSFKGSWDGRRAGCDVRIKDGTPVLISRTGYTGELGFELYMSSDTADTIWNLIKEKGCSRGLLPCGLASRDSLRAGAGLPLSGVDTGNWPFIRNPWEFVLPFDDEKRQFTRDFYGSDALLSHANPEWTYAFAGYDPRKISVGMEAAVQDLSGKAIGRVSTCVTDMGIGRINGTIVSIASPSRDETFMPGGLSCGFIRVKNPLKTGEQVILSDKRRNITVEIVDDIRPDRTARLTL